MAKAPLFDLTSIKAGKGLSFATAFILWVAASAVCAQPVTGRSVTYRYVEVKDSRFLGLQRTVQDSRILEELSERLSERLILPEQLTLALAECGTPNALYDQDRRAVVVCYELIADVARRVDADFNQKGRGDLGKPIMVGALAFAFAHELAHALVHILQLPITGREEDVADQIAVFLLLRGGQNIAIRGIQGAAWFNDTRESAYTEQNFADVHALGPQRKFNIVCWAFGKDPQTFSGLAQTVNLPRERAEQCAGEYETIDRSITFLLRDHVRR